MFIKQNSPNLEGAGGEVHKPGETPPLGIAAAHRGSNMCGNLILNLLNELVKLILCEAFYHITLEQNMFIKQNSPILRGAQAG